MGASLTQKLQVSNGATSMSAALWGVGVLVALALIWLALWLIPHKVSGDLFLKQELKKRNIPHERLPQEFFDECVQWAERLSSFTGHSSVIKKKAEFVYALENLANMLELWIKSTEDPMFQTHGETKNSYRVIFEKYDFNV